MIQFSSLEQAKNYFLEFAPKTWGSKYQGGWGLDKVKKFLRFIGNPQNQYPCLHIAGTSGKGSTAYFCSYILAGQKRKVGLHVSPYLEDFREQFSINNKFLSLKLSLEYISEFVSLYQNWLTQNSGVLSYYELVVCLSFYIFYKQKVDYAVIEVSLGGLFDSTNVITSPNKVCLINTIGYDHTEVLGDTITQIAKQKAGIIQPYNKVFVIRQAFEEAEDVFKTEAELQNADLVMVGPTSNTKSGSKIYFKFLQSDKNGNIFEFKSPEIPSQKFAIKTLGKFQTANCSLALSACEYVLKRDRQRLNIEELKKSLLQVKIPARLQIIDQKKLCFEGEFNQQQVILDGAHNLQKIQSLVSSLEVMFGDQKFLVLCGFSSLNKDVEIILNTLGEISSQIIITQFSSRVSQSVGKKSQNLDKLIAIAKASKIPISIHPNLSQAALKVFQNKSNPVLVTGSFYLISDFLQHLQKT
jgi:dihydrofolate synthase/folylpolyglutamate synthase